VVFQVILCEKIASDYAVKIPQFLEKPPLSEAKKHHEDKGTSCLHNVTTNIKFDDGWKGRISNICQKVNIFSEYLV
jgi:hypothetical protein